MGYVFQTRIGKGGIIIFTSKFFFGEGFIFETLHFFENQPPWDVINNRSLSLL